MSGFIGTPSMADIERLERRIALLERQYGLPELREELAIHVDSSTLTAAAAEANERCGKQLGVESAESFARIVVDVINRGRS